MNKVSQMKVTKALKLKNKLAGEVSNLKQMLKIQNSRPTKQPFDYDRYDEHNGFGAAALSRFTNGKWIST